MNIIQSLIRRALVTLAGADDKDFPQSQVSYLGKTADIEMINPYGVHSNLPANDQVLVTMWSVAGQEDQRIGMGYTPLQRFKNTPAGEVIFYHPIAKSRLQFKNNGDIELDVTGDNGDAIITIKKDLSITVGGNATINVTGDATTTIGGNSITTILGNETSTVAGNAIIGVTGTAAVTCPTTTWVGDINVTGNIAITGALGVTGLTVLAAVTSNGKNVGSTHQHDDSGSYAAGGDAVTGTSGTPT